MNDVWDIIFNQDFGWESLRCVGISVPLKQEIEHEAVLVYCPPEPVTHTINTCADLIQKPLGTPPGFPVTQTICEE